MEKTRLQIKIMQRNMDAMEIRNQEKEMENKQIEVENEVLKREYRQDRELRNITLSMKLMPPESLEHRGP
jgi:hypothetical protein